MCRHVHQVTRHTAFGLRAYRQIAQKVRHGLLAARGMESMARLGYLLCVGNGG